jgi:hypothetical protein
VSRPAAVGVTDGVDLGADLLEEEPAFDVVVLVVVVLVVFLIKINTPFW